MSTSKILSLMTFVGLLFLCLMVFGFTWKVFGISFVISGILSIIYYRLIFSIGEDENGKSKVQ